jgi:hypothetical protein
LALGLVAGLLAGCGGDRRRAETETGEATTQPTAVQQPPRSGPVRVTKVTVPARRSYIGRVDAICGKVDGERSADEQEVGAARSTSEAAKAYDDTVALGWRELKRIESVSPPPGDGPLLRANVFDTVREQLRLRAQIGRALSAVEVPRLRALRALLDDSTRALTGFARGYGFRVCGEA